MVRVAKGKGKKNKKENESSDSENDHYDDDFDPKNPFGDDEIESFHENRDKILLNNLSKKKKTPFHYSSDEEEVLAFDGEDDDDDDDDEENYDLEDDEDLDEDDVDESKQKEEEDYDLVKSTWGSKKIAYYSGNKIQNHEDAELEEEEAKILQAKMMKQLDTNDFGLDAFKIDKEKKVLKTSTEIEANKIAEKAFDRPDYLEEKNLEKVVKNLSKMTRKEKLDFLQQESPELFELVRDFKAKIGELQETLIPTFKSIKQGHIPHSMASDFIVNKTKLYLMYCSYLSFYFVLKSERSPIENHPIVKNILQFRNLCKQINPLNEQLEDEIKFIVDSINNGKQISFKKQSDLKLKKVKKSVKFRDSLRNNNLVFGDNDDDSEKEEKMDDQETNVVDDPLSGKRAINYQIEKNKGLTPKRDKSYRNPRVRNRLKARKADIKYKSIVPKVRTQDKRYSGEATGIRTGVVRGVKIK